MGQGRCSRHLLTSPSSGARDGRLRAPVGVLQRVLLEQPAGGGAGEPVSVVVHGVEADDLERLLQLMYRGQARVPAHQLPRLLDSARALGVRLLQSAALRVCAADAPDAAAAAAAAAGQQVQIFQGEPHERSHQMLENEDGRAPPVVSATIRPLLAQSRPSPVEEGFSVSPSPESTEQMSYSTKHHLPGAQTLTSQPPQGLTLQRSLQSEAAGMQVQRERPVAPWGAPPAAALPLHLQLQHGAAAAAACHRPDPRSAAAHASQAAGAGNSAPGEWQVPPQQEQRFDGKSQADSNQRLPAAVSAFIRPMFPLKPPGTTEYKVTVSKEQTSAMESTAKYGPKYHSASAQTPPAQGFAPQGALRPEAGGGQVAMTSSWCSPPPPLPSQQPAGPVQQVPAQQSADPAQPAAAAAAAPASQPGEPDSEWQPPPLPGT